MADPLLHPVRLGVVGALSGGRRLSVAELRGELGEVPQATLYRHVNALVRAGILDAVDERPARGTPERVYALNEAALDAADDHVQQFALFLATLLGDWSRNADDPDAGYRQVHVWLRRDELAELLAGFSQALAPTLEHGPAPGRRRHALAVVVVPAE